MMKKRAAFLQFASASQMSCQMDFEDVSDTGPFVGIDIRNMYMVNSAVFKKNSILSQKYH